MAEVPEPYQIEFSPSGLIAIPAPDETVLDAARRLGLGLRSVCGGFGTCRACRVRLLAGEMTSFTQNELERLSAQELAGGYRLACQCKPVSDVRIDIPLESVDAPLRMAVAIPHKATVLDPNCNPVGLAVDLGSTRLAAYLVRMADGQVLATADCLNPQIAYGEDIIARISFADRAPEGGQVLHRAVITAVDDLATELCAAVDADAGRIDHAVLAG